MLQLLPFLLFGPVANRRDARQRRGLRGHFQVVAIGGDLAFLRSHSSPSPGCCSFSHFFCSAPSRIAEMPASGADFAATSRLSPLVEILPFTDSPPGRTTTSSPSDLRLFSAAQGIDTSPSSSLFSVSLAPSFWITLPVSVSPFLSTTWSAKSVADPHSISVRVRKRKSVPL